MKTTNLCGVKLFEAWGFAHKKWWKHRVAVRKKRFLNGLFHKVGVRVAGSFVVLTEIISGQFTAKAQKGPKKTLINFLHPKGTATSGWLFVSAAEYSDTAPNSVGRSKQKT
jgi:hypothetical protein